jgi:hypothetical protein
MSVSYNPESRRSQEQGDLPPMSGARRRRLTLGPGPRAGCLHGRPGASPGQPGSTLDARLPNDQAAGPLLRAAPLWA